MGGEKREGPRVASSSAWRRRAKPRMGEHATENEAGNSLEMPDIARDELETVADRGRGDLEIGVRERAAALLQPGLDLAVNARNSHVEWEDRDPGQHALLDVLEVESGSLGPKGPLVELRRDDRARELVLARHGAKPYEVCRCGPLPKDLGNGVGVEEKGHSAPEAWPPARSRPSDRARVRDELLGAAPTTRDGREALFRPGGPEPVDPLGILCGHDRRNVPAVPPDHHDGAGLGFADDLGEASLRFDDGNETNRAGAHMTSLVIMIFQDRFFNGAVATGPRGRAQGGGHCQ